MLSKKDLMKLSKEELVNMVLELQKDPLTGFLKRQFLEEGDCCGKVVALCDINGLKQINDKFGHEEGDNYILKVCQSIRENTREKDSVVRWGGDEFIIIFNDCTEEQVRKICSRITNVCCGIGTGVDIKNAIRVADKNMYEVKRKMYREGDKC